MESNSYQKRFLSSFAENRGRKAGNKYQFSASADFAPPRSNVAGTFDVPPKEEKPSPRALAEGIPRAARSEPRCELLARGASFLVIGGVVFFAAILSYPVLAFGQGIGISISPLTFEITANPGDKVSNVLKILNNSDSALVVQMTAEDFTAVGESGEVVVREELNESFSLAKWIRVEPEQFTLDPRGQQLVNFTIEVPVSGEPGGHYGSILAMIGGTAAAGTGAAISQKVGSLLLLQVAGPVNELIFVKNFIAPSFSEYGPITIDARFENRGTVHLKPRGFVQITDIFGKQAANLSLSQKNILPGSVRKIDTVWDKKILFGKYTAILTAIYGSTNEPLTATTTFWVIPWKITLGITFGIVLVLFILIKSRRRLSLALKILLRGETK